MRRRICALIIILLSSVVQAQTLSVRCKFVEGQVTNFEGGSPETVRKNDFSDMVFDQIDLSTNTARLIGNIGTETVRAIKGLDSVHLIEVTSSGNINITTIFFLAAVKAPFNLPVVHSRHVNILGKPLPSQYVGLCTKLL